MDNVLLLKEKTAFRNKDFDENGNVRASALLRHFEQIATDHAELMGIGHDDLMKKNWIWVLSKLRFRMHGKIREGELYDIATYPSMGRGAAYPRGYYICDEDENLIVSAMSQWCIVDFETRKLVRSALEFSGEYIDIPAFEEKIEKIKYSDPQAAGAHTVTEEDLDINCHVNNCRYADMTSEILDRNDFQSFTINFLKETVVGDRIDMFMERAEDGSDIVVGMLEDKSVVFQAKVTYL